MNPKVSVIVPVYGAEAFLPTCISSLRAQTLRDIELIFVCDGSPDHSLAGDSAPRGKDGQPHPCHRL